MSQTWDSSAPATTNDWDDDIPAIKNKFDSLQSNFSGTGAPASPAGGQGWTDTGSTTHKRRNSANTAWLADLHGDANFKIPVYRNDTCDGWVIDTTVTDRVIALKGGSDAYNVNGGTNAGTSWANLEAHTHAMGDHNHKWHEYTNSSSSNSTFNASGGSQTLTTGGTTGTYRGISAMERTWSGSSSDSRLQVDGYTNNAGSGVNTGASSMSDARPAAAVHTLQYPDFT